MRARKRTYRLSDRPHVDGMRRCERRVMGADRPAAALAEAAPGSPCQGSSPNPKWRALGIAHVRALGGSTEALWCCRHRIVAVLPAAAGQRVRPGAVVPASGSAWRTRPGHALRRRYCCTKQGRVCDQAATRDSAARPASQRAQVGRRRPGLHQLTPFVSTSGTWAHGLPRASAMRRSSPAQTGATATAIKSSASRSGSRSGALLPQGMRRQARA